MEEIEEEQIESLELLEDEEAEDADGGGECSRIWDQVSTYYPELTQGYIEYLCDQYVLERRTTIRKFLGGGDCTDRYIVASIDPAAGGAASRETMLLFLTQGTNFGLLGGVVLPRQSGHTIPVLPEQYVSQIYDMIELFLESHRTELLQGPNDTMPPVLVVIENNFAYGAGPYVRFMDPAPGRHLNSDILIATQVFGVDYHAMWMHAELLDLKNRYLASREEYKRQEDEAINLWRLRGRRKGLNFTAIRQELRKHWPDTCVKPDGPVDRPGINQMPGDGAADPNPGQKWMDETHKIYKNLLGGDRARQLNDEEKKQFDEEQRKWQQLGTALHKWECDHATYRAYERATKVAFSTMLHPFVAQPKQWVESVAYKDIVVTNVNNKRRQVVRLEETELRRAASGKEIFGVSTREKGPGFMRILQGLRRDLALLPMLLVKEDEMITTSNLRICPEGERLSSLEVAYCMLDQFKNLRAKFGTTQEGDIMVCAVEGKVEEKRDDVYMAWTIGVQWCTQFAQLLHSADQRWTLVHYTRNLAQVSRRTLQDMRPGNRQYSTNARCPVCRPRPAHVTQINDRVGRLLSMNAVVVAPMQVTGRFRLVCFTAAWLTCLYKIGNSLLRSFRLLFLQHLVGVRDDDNAERKTILDYTLHSFIRAAPVKWKAKLPGVIEDKFKVTKQFFSFKTQGGGLWPDSVTIPSFFDNTNTYVHLFDALLHLLDTTTGTFQHDWHPTMHGWAHQLRDMGKGMRGVADILQRCAASTPMAQFEEAQAPEAMSVLGRRWALDLRDGANVRPCVDARYTDTESPLVGLTSWLADCKMWLSRDRRILKNAVLKHGGHRHRFAIPNTTLCVHHWTARVPIYSLVARDRGIVLDTPAPHEQVVVTCLRLLDRQPSESELSVPLPQIGID